MDCRFPTERALILAPHTDDGEFGCGGTLARLLREGCAVHYVAFSTCEESVTDGKPKDILEIEFRSAMRVFGLGSNDFTILHFPVRHFQERRQEVLDCMLSIGSSFAPDTVFMPSLQDVHQDHCTIAAEAVRAFKRNRLFAYEVPWNNLSFQNQAFIKLEESDLEQKIKAISCYESQSQRLYASADFTTSQARYHGVQAGCEYAEVFEVVRWIC